MSHTFKFAEPFNVRELDTMGSHVSAYGCFCLLLGDLAVKEDVKALHATLAVIRRQLVHTFGNVEAYRGIHAILDSPST